MLWLEKCHTLVSWNVSLKYFYNLKYSNLLYTHIFFVASQKAVKILFPLLLFSVIVDPVLQTLRYNQKRSSCRNTSADESSAWLLCFILLPCSKTLVNLSSLKLALVTMATSLIPPVNLWHQQLSTVVLFLMVRMLLLWG